MKISIVTISYNQSEFLERAIRSVIEQDYEDIEYIVVDPGSTDGSRKIIERYHSRIDKFIFEPDAGPADGLNKGFSAAEGDIYGYINSDDMFLPGTFSLIANFFKEHPSIDILAGDALIIDSNDHTIRKAYSDSFSLIRYAYRACTTIQQSTFVRKDVFRKVKGFKTKNHIAWDGELLVDMILAGANFQIFRGTLSAFRIHPSGITGSKKNIDAYERYRQYIFTKIMNRPLCFHDRLLSVGLRIVNHVMNPRNLYERILYGPISRGKMFK